MRMQTRRLTRLTDGFSKKFESLWAALALYFAWYNFCRVHKTLRVTPAIEAGVADHVWTVQETVGVENIGLRVLQAPVQPPSTACSIVA